MILDLQTIHVISEDDYATCPVCDVRPPNDLVEHKPCGEDEDGPIYSARCLTHGWFRFQTQPCIDEDDEEIVS